MLGTVSVSHSAEEDAKLRSDLEKIAQRRVLFGHQSVGENLLDGIRQLSTTAGVPVRVAEIKAANSMTPGTIGHALIAENEYPLKKLKSFEQIMEQQRAGTDIAFMKFCYVDFTAETNAKELFASYQASMDSLRKKNPVTTFVHVTAPLTTVGGGPKAKLKYFLGMAPLYGTVENMRRQEFNNLLRQTYRGREPIFDLARVESTAPNGKEESVKWDGSVVPVLVPEYSDDGGHLNSAGKLRAARELISVLASIPDRAAAR
jgi:hypothetical protein